MMVRHISYHIIYHIYQSKAEDVKGWQILTCLERSSAELMGATMRSTVRKAARLAVYEEIKIKEKNHHTPPTILPEMDLGVMSIPCCMNAPSANQRLLITLKWLLTVVPDIDSSICHSYGENLLTRKSTMLTPM